jgi:cytochrome c-type protein NapC
MWVKAHHGIRDPLMEMIKDPYDIDWHGHRELRENYVYDSACISCHKNLEERSQANSKAILPHRDYFAEPDRFTCVGCHKHVGHHALGNHLQAMGWELPDKE